MGVLRDKWERKALGFTTEAQDLQLCRGVVTVSPRAAPTLPQPRPAA